MFTPFDPKKPQEENHSGGQLDDLSIDRLEVDEKCCVHQQKRGDEG